MTREALATLFHPFEAGVIDAPGAGQRVLFLGAEPGFRLPEGFAAELTAVQGFRPDFLGLQKGGYTVVPEPQGEEFDAALVLASRHRGQNEARLADAILRVRPGGLVAMAGGKTDGVAPLRKRLKSGDDQSGTGPVPLDGHLSKNHAVVFWLRRAGEAEAYATSIRQVQATRPLVEGRFETAPGMFSHEHVDAGSRLLADCLPADLKGDAADFCAGWGFLSVALSERTAQVKSIDLYEADHASLEAASRNMARLAPGVAGGLFWHDLAAEKVTKKYDAIVMNPPFHQGRAAEPEIGEKMIRAAAGALKSGGRLFVVANRQLPYERVLGGAFSKVEELAREGGFKVLSARR